MPADRLEDRPTKAAQIIPNLLEDASHLQLAHPSYRFEAVSGHTSINCEADIGLVPKVQSQPGRDEIA